MFQQIAELGNQLLGLQSDRLTVYQMALRTLITYVFVVGIIRLGDRRFFGKHAVFDGVLAIVLGSTVSRGINGQAPFFPTLGAGAVLILLHWLTAVLAFRSEKVRRIIEDKALLLVKNGVLQWEGMRQSKITEDDVEESMRTHGVSDFSLVKESWLEAAGQISIVKQAMVVDIDVKDGVQTVPVEFGA